MIPFSSSSEKPNLISFFVVITAVGTVTDMFAFVG